MDVLDRVIREHLKVAGLFGHAADDSLHLPGLVLEQLVGPVNDSNRRFLSSRLPDQSKMILVLFRRQLLREGDGFTQAYGGTAFILDSIPKTTPGDVDLAPVGIYFDSRLAVVRAEDMPPRPPRRSLLQLEHPIPRRRRFARA